MSNINASGLNGGYVCPVFANTCHTNQLDNNDVYLLFKYVLIKGASNNAEYVNHAQLRI